MFDFIIVWQLYSNKHGFKKLYDFSGINSFNWIGKSSVKEGLHNYP